MTAIHFGVQKLCFWAQAELAQSELLLPPRRVYQSSEGTPSPEQSRLGCNHL